MDHLTGLTVSRENSTDALTSLTLEPGDQVQLTAQVPTGPGLPCGTWEPSPGRWRAASAPSPRTDCSPLRAPGALRNPHRLCRRQSQTITVSLENSHEDVPDGHWAYTAVDYCYANGLVGGISDTEFGPDLHIRRGDFC